MKHLIISKPLDYHAQQMKQSMPKQLKQASKNTTNKFKYTTLNPHVYHAILA